MRRQGSKLTYDKADHARGFSLCTTLFIYQASGYSQL